MTIADTAWYLDNISLNTAAYWVRSLGFNEDSPVRRGENQISPGVSGRRHTDKVFDQRVLPLLMVIDAAPPGGGERSGSQLALNVDVIKALFSVDGTHELKRTHGGNTRVATVEVRQLRISPAGPYHYNVAAELVFADPFWYAASKTTVSKTFTGALPDTMAVSNAGTYKAERVEIRIWGPITDPKVALRNSWIQYTGELPLATDYLTIDTGAFTVVVTTSIAMIANGLSDITWADGMVRWLEIPPGASSASLSGAKGAGDPKLQLTFTEAYL